MFSYLSPCYWPGPHDSSMRQLYLPTCLPVSLLSPFICLAALAEVMVSELLTIFVFRLVFPFYIAAAVCTVVPGLCASLAPMLNFQSQYTFAFVWVGAPGLLVILVSHWQLHLSPCLGNGVTFVSRFRSPFLFFLVWVVSKLS